MKEGKRIKDRAVSGTALWAALSAQQPARLEVLSLHDVLQPLPERGEGSKLQHSSCASLLAHNVYPAVQVTRFWWEKCLIGPSFLQGCYMTAYSPKLWPMAMEDQLSLLSSLLLFIFFLRLISKNHKRRGSDLTNRAAAPALCHSIVV